MGEERHIMIDDTRCKIIDKLMVEVKQLSSFYDVFLLSAPTSYVFFSRYDFSFNRLNL